MTLFKWAAIRAARIFLLTFRLFPVRRDKVLFSASFGKGYFCNPAAVCEAILRKYPGRLRIYWALRNPRDFRHLQKRGIRTVRRKSPAWVYHCLTAKVVVDNFGIPSYLPLRRSQVFVNTWHGGGAYKRVGLHDPSLTPRERDVLKIIGRQTGAFVSACAAFSRVMTEAFALRPGIMLEVGMPRNDLFFRPTDGRRRKVRRELGFAESDRLVLYAPTFRGRFGGGQDAPRDRPPDAEGLVRALEARFGGTFRFLYRAHYSVTERNARFGTDVSDRPDMQELLAACDVLVTDYSSCMWDFSLTGRPCFVYAPDLAEYTDGDRGFYTPVSRWPFPVARNNEELRRAVAAFDEAEYRRKIREHHEELGSFETGRASEAVADYIRSRCRGKGP